MGPWENEPFDGLIGIGIAIILLALVFLPFLLVD